MSATKTQAFILKTQDYRDTSILGDFYTRDFGKIKGIVKGVRDARGRFGSTLEPFSLNEILFYRRKRGGDLHQVTQFEVLEFFPALREDLERLGTASYFTELLDELVEAVEANTAIFRLLQDALSFLSGGASPKRTARIFEVKLLELLGLMPEIRSCVVCRSGDVEAASFSVPMGGIVCRACRETKEAPGVPVSRGALNFLEHARRKAFENLRPVKVSREVGEDLEKMLRRFVDFHLPNKLKSVTFLEKMELV